MTHRYCNGRLRVNGGIKWVKVLYFRLFILRTLCFFCFFIYIYSQTSIPISIAGAMLLKRL